MWILVALGCGDRPDSDPWTRVTQGRTYEVTLELPDPVPVGELFSVRTMVRHRDGAPVEDAQVRVDARMPGHDHGMETRPVGDGTAEHPDGIYETHGFKFHMRGAWTVRVEVQGPRGADDTAFRVDVP